MSILRLSIRAHENPLIHLICTYTHTHKISFWRSLNSRWVIRISFHWNICFNIWIHTRDGFKGMLENFFCIEFGVLQPNGRQNDEFSGLIATPMHFHSREYWFVSFWQNWCCKTHPSLSLSLTRSHRYRYIYSLYGYALTTVQLLEMISFKHIPLVTTNEQFLFNFPVL